MVIEIEPLEKLMDWLAENWFWLAVFGLFIWMHMGMHGGHGHGGHGHGEREPREHGHADSNGRGKHSTDAEKPPP